MPVFGRRQHPAVLVASARVSPEPFRSRCARSRIRAPCAARVRAGACVCTGSARGEIRGRRSSSNGGLHAGSSVERINGNAWRTAARRGAVAIAQRRSSNPAVRRASIESRCARHIVLAWIDCTARACSRAGTIDRRMAQYANVARDARNERNLATCIGAPRVSAIMQLMRHMAARRPNTATLPEWLRLATRAVLAIMRKAFR